MERTKRYAMVQIMRSQVPLRLWRRLDVVRVPSPKGEVNQSILISCEASHSLENYRCWPCRDEKASTWDSSSEFDPELQGFEECSLSE